ncbi:MAG: hypothetical protein COZ80_11945 [Ignavibacteria bacterium CG_4_8_14_3_um_filter_37_9]|nr:hypothetical protein [Ignavibacteria bacterium]OIO14162.1 MAG: hypothetical protein AUJ54_14700 [Ignavibacteria bacterium CG1_02_37_35]PIP77005.1 MAG: hypothetical protein COW85_11220 [Ignavibacteria bacterium CG22_combo_CG10-13_8_21_14_all_37_15]PIS46264.1 MAG: hypothetical protein COT22_00945 [Ignavibacteria bacterium CG08_land_8_20_14_0_20_37_9]PIW98169.1 MAG: hypothetical protein COZ80_11945 [Ignavibacteria bacterium CG_4_8_14_3_um_filter_37_9]PIX95400.1 MAG: hypothetical protein COZ25_
MKNVFMAFFLFFLSFQLIIEAQSISVKESKEISIPEAGEHFFPRFASGDSLIYFTRSYYKGILSFNLFSKDLKNITAEPGSGFEYQFTDDGSKIFYRTDTYQNGKKYSDIKTIDLRTNKIEFIENGKRNLSTPKILKSGDCIFKQDADITVNNKLKKTMQLNIIPQDTLLFYSDNNLILLINGLKKTFNPLGDGSYLWSSLSPNKEKILFTFMGKGTYVTDLDGNVVLELGYANAPKWSSDGKWIAYMEDKDDGVQVISSEIFLLSVDGKEKIQLTESKEIHEQFPEWSPNMKSIVCHTSDGKIILLSLEKKY